MTSINLAVIPGDRVGPEVVAESLKVLDTVCEALSRPEIATHTYDLGTRRYLATSEALMDANLENIKERDTVLLGAIGDPRVPSGVLERGLLLKLYFALDHCVSLRPNRHYPGVPTPLADPDGVDFPVVREGTEGFYCGSDGVVRQGTPHRIATEVSVSTAYGIGRVVRYTSAKTQARPHKRLTYVHEHSVLVNTGGLWRHVVEEIGAEYPDAAVDYMHVGATTIFLVTDPARFDVIAMDNLFDDILTDEAGAITGGIGLAASGNINPEGAFPPMFEPIHGSALDVTDRQIADPMATITSVTLMFDRLGLAEHAQATEDAIGSDMTARTSATKAGAPLKRSTSDIRNAVATLIRG